MTKSPCPQAIIPTPRDLHFNHSINASLHFLFRTIENISKCTRVGRQVGIKKAFFLLWNLSDTISFWVRWSNLVNGSWETHHGCQSINPFTTIREIQSISILYRLKSKNKWPELISGKKLDGAWRISFPSGNNTTFNLFWSKLISTYILEKMGQQLAYKKELITKWDLLLITQQSRAY